MEIEGLETSKCVISISRFVLKLSNNVGKKKLRKTIYLPVRIFVRLYTNFLNNMQS